MTLWKLKSCPHCTKGDLIVDRDGNNWFEYCLQCGYRHDLKKRKVLPKVHEQSLAGEVKE
jgi:hypothetical protein